MPEPMEELTPDLVAVEERVLPRLRALPGPSPAFEGRLMALARERSEAARRQSSARTLVARTRRFGLLVARPAAAAALLLVAALVAGKNAPVPTPLANLDRPHAAPKGAIKVVSAAGAFGHGARPKPTGTTLAPDEPIVVAPGGHLLLELPDGTKLGLDGGSAGALAFHPDARRILLERGRLWADVVPVATGPDPRPILVETPSGRARVLGTELVLRATPARTLVGVRHGLVRIEGRAGRHTDVEAEETGLLCDELPPLARKTGAIERQFRWIGKLQPVAAHACERPTGGGPVSDDESALGRLVARLADGRELPLRLRAQEFKAEVVDGLVRVTARCTFTNHTTEALEGTFSLQLPQQASIARYAVTIDGQWVEGSVVERERARQIYEEAKARLDQPALLEWAQGNVFTAKVHPIEPSAEKSIEVSWVEELTERDGVERVVLPLVSGASELAPERLAIEVRLRGDAAQAPFRSPSHYLRAAQQGNERVLRLEAANIRPRNDFVLELARPAAPAVEAWLEPGEELAPATAMVRLRPRLGSLLEEELPERVAILLDASRSQTGTLKEVQLELLEALLQSLPPRARPRVFLLHVDLEELDGAGPNRAETLLSQVWAAEPVGGADYARGFARLGRVLPPDWGGTLVLVGDGLPTCGVREPAELAATFASSLPPAQLRRVITVGLGSVTDAALLGRLARERAGVHVGLRPGDDLSRKLDEVLGALTRPVLTQVGVQLAIPGSRELVPRKPASLRAGEALNLLARVPAAARGGEVVLSGVVNGRSFRLRTPFSFRRAPRAAGLDGLWARKRVQDLLETGPATKPEVLALALDHGIVTPYTSLLVLPEEKRASYAVEAQARRKERRILELGSEVARLLQANDDREAARALEQLARLAGEDPRVKQLQREVEQRLGIAEPEDVRPADLPEELALVPWSKTAELGLAGTDEEFYAQAVDIVNARRLDRYPEAIRMLEQIDRRSELYTDAQAYLQWIDADVNLRAARQAYAAGDDELALEHLSAARLEESQEPEAKLNAMLEQQFPRLLARLPDPMAGYFCWVAAKTKAPALARLNAAGPTSSESPFAEPSGFQDSRGTYAYDIWSNGANGVNELGAQEMQTWGEVRELDGSETDPESRRAIEQLRAKRDARLERARLESKVAEKEARIADLTKKGRPYTPDELEAQARAAADWTPSDGDPERYQDGHGREEAARALHKQKGELTAEPANEKSQRERLERYRAAIGEEKVEEILTETRDQLERIEERLGREETALQLAERGKSQQQKQQAAQGQREELARKLAQDLDQSLAIDPSSVDSTLARASLRVKQGDLQGALADAERAIALDPTNQDAYFARGMARQKLGDAEGAERDFREVLKAKPSSEEEPSSGMAMFGAVQGDPSLGKVLRDARGEQVRKELEKAIVVHDSIEDEVEEKKPEAPAPKKPEPVETPKVPPATQPPRKTREVTPPSGSKSGAAPPEPMVEGRAFAFGYTQEGMNTNVRSSGLQDGKPGAPDGVAGTPLAAAKGKSTGGGAPDKPATTTPAHGFDADGDGFRDDGAMTQNVSPDVGRPGGAPSLGGSFGGGFNGGSGDEQDATEPEKADKSRRKVVTDYELSSGGTGVVAAEAQDPIWGIAEEKPQAKKRMMVGLPTADMVGSSEASKANAATGKDSTLEVHDVSEIVQNPPDFPAPELGLNLGGGQGGGGGAAGGTLSFNEGDEQRSSGQLDAEKLQELIETRLGEENGATGEIHRGQLIVRGSPEAQENVKKLVGALRRSATGLPDPEKRRFDRPEVAEGQVAGLAQENDRLRQELQDIRALVTDGVPSRTPPRALADPKAENERLQKEIQDIRQLVCGDERREVTYEHYKTTILDEANKRLQEILGQEYVATRDWDSLRDQPLQEAWTKLEKYREGGEDGVPTLDRIPVLGGLHGGGAEGEPVSPGSDSSTLAQAGRVTQGPQRNLRRAQLLARAGTERAAVELQRGDFVAPDASGQTKTIEDSYGAAVTQSTVDAIAVGQRSGVAAVSSFPPAQRIDLDVQNAELTDVMDQLGRQVGRNILVEPNVKETVSVSLREIPWNEAVDVIARMARCEVEERPGGILLLTQPPKVTIQFTDANVRTVLQLLASQSGKNVIIAPEVQGRVSLDIKEMHWRQALHSLVRQVGDFEVVEESDDLLRVVPRHAMTRAGGIEMLRQELGYLERDGAEDRPARFAQLKGLAARQPADVRVWVLGELIRWTPEDVDLHEWRGLALLELGRPAAAWRAFSGMVEAAPDSAEAHARYGRALLRMGLPAQGLDELREAVRLEPASEARRFELARTAAACGLARTAGQVYLELIRGEFADEVKQQAGAELRALTGGR